MPRLKSGESSDNQGEFAPGLNAMGEREVDYYNAISQIAPDFLAHTALYEERPWTPEDTERIRDFLVVSAPYSNPKLMPGFWEHTLLASIYAEILTDHVKPLDITQAEAEGLELLHDIGRIISPDQYYRNELLADLIFKKGNNKTSSELAKLPDNSQILGLRGKPVTDIHDHTPAQRITRVADWLGKFNTIGDLVTPEEIINSSNASFKRYREKEQWLTTKIGISAIEAGKGELGNQLFTDAVSWLRQSGVDLDKVRDEVRKKFDDPDLKKWLFDALNAQESISREVDERLGRPPVRHIIFEAGGVLLENSQLAFCEALSKKCGVAVEKIEIALAKLDLPELISGEIPSSAYLTEFFSEIGITGWPEEEMLSAFQYEEIHKPTEGMPELIEALSQNPDVTLSILSDSITAVIPPMVKKLKEYYPQITDVQISAEIGASKRDPEGGAFKHVLGHLGVEDPRTAVFVDDKQAFTTSARSKVGLRALTFRGNPYRNISPVDRMRQEFSDAGLIKQ
jgi:FMN phosphatase YigB (HAD superfamily)